jgi:hypothetical protein
VPLLKSWHHLLHAFLTNLRVHIISMRKEDGL